MSYSHIEKEIQCVVHWFQGWSTLQKQDFFKDLLDKCIPCHMDALFDSMKYMNVKDKPPSIFECQMKLFTQWFDAWTRQERDIFISKLREINPEFVDEFDKQECPSCWCESSSSTLKSMPKRKRSNPTITKKYKRKRNQPSTSTLTSEVENRISNPAILCADVGIQCDHKLTVNAECQSVCTFLNNKNSITQCDSASLIDIGLQCNTSNNSDVSTQSDGPHTVDFTCQFDGVDLKNELDDLPHPFILQKHSEKIEILSVLDVDNTTYVKLKVVISKSGRVTVFVHDKLLNDNNPLWLKAQQHVYTKKDVLNVLACLSNFNVCIGNPDEEFQSLIPVGAGISVSNDDTIVAYREKNFNAVQGKIKYDSTIRSSNCTLLVSGQKCSACHLKRKLLKQRYDRQKSLIEREFDFTKCTFKHCDMPREVLMKKIEWQKTQINFLQAKVDKLERQLKQKISKEGVRVNAIQDLELKDLMATCEKDVIQAFPDSSCLQRLFWSQQLKCVQNTKTGMRWHPMIIRWCLAIRHKSQVAYDTIREAGFITLPSNRTLFDYSHYIKSNLGLNADSLKLLKNEAEKQDMYQEEWRKFIGILFDEVKVKEDLVYDRVSGELIGYCNLDEVGNSIMNLENLICGQENEVAKYVLVLMVRSVTTSLKFPLAAYATQSITSDFLYPIIWNSIAVLEVHLGLNVLFLTCDGASANRKFFTIWEL